MFFFSGVLVNRQSSINDQWVKEKEKKISGQLYTTVFSSTKLAMKRNLESASNIINFCIHHQMDQRRVQFQSNGFQPNLFMLGFELKTL